MFSAKRTIERSQTSGGFSGLVALAILAAGMAYFTPPAPAQQTGQKTFASASEATKALIAALQMDDQPALASILGPDANDILSSGDAVEDKNDRDQFVQKYQQMHRMVMEPDGKTTLYVGAENWPTPIPLVHKGAAWYFDTPAGKMEILYRRVGMNELAVIQTCRELVDAEKEYFSQPHDGDTTKQYARKFFSDPGKHNGLYWLMSPGDHESPIGPLVASAAVEGYVPPSPDSQPQPFMGYYFRVLTSQGAGALGGRRNYLADGKMTRGFAFIAYPAEYRSSGVMTFIVDQNGIVYEKNLGARTAEIAKAMPRYDRDPTWRKAD